MVFENLTGPWPSRYGSASVRKTRVSGRRRMEWPWPGRRLDAALEKVGRAAAAVTVALKHPGCGVRAGHLSSPAKPPSGIRFGRFSPVTGDFRPYGLCS